MAVSRPSAIFNELEDRLQCALCSDVCSDPRMLPCLHWYCANCIEKLFDSSDKFNCPSCRTEIPRPTEGATQFPAAFLVNEIDKAVRIRKEAQPKRPTMCLRHKKPLDAYCVTCNQKLCITCMLAHDGHEKLMISELQQQMEKPIKDTIHAMQEQVEQCEAELIKMSRAKHDTISTRDVKRKHLKDHGKKLMNKLQETIDKMDQQIGDQISGTIHKYESNERKIKNEMSKRTEAIVQMKAYLKDKGSSDLLDLESYKALLQNRDHCVPIPEIEIHLKLSDLAKLTDELLLGTITTEPQSGATAGKVLPPSELHIVKTHTFDLPCAPGGIACDQEGNVAVCGVSDRTVHIFTHEGKKLSEIKPGIDIHDVAASKDRWYITEMCMDNGKLFIFEKEGRRVDTVSVGYKGEGGVALSESHLYITSAKENLVYRLELPDGSNKKVFVKNSTFKKYLDYPMFVATNGKCVAVSSNHSHQVSLFDIDGNRLMVYGKEGSGPSQLRNPWGVAIDRKGRVHVADFGNNRISILSHSGHRLLNIELGKDYFPGGLALFGNTKIVVGCQAFMSAQQKVSIYQYEK